MITATAATAQPTPSLASSAWPAPLKLTAPRRNSAALARSSSGPADRRRRIASMNVFTKPLLLHDGIRSYRLAPGWFEVGAAVPATPSMRQYTWPPDGIGAAMHWSIACKRSRSDHVLRP